jgi:hypothetical protein
MLKVTETHEFAEKMVINHVLNVAGGVINSTGNWIENFRVRFV